MNPSWVCSESTTRRCHHCRLRRCSQCMPRTLSRISSPACRGLRKTKLAISNLFLEVQLIGTAVSLREGKTLEPNFYIHQQNIEDALFRYTIIKVLGYGVYGTVLECHDQKYGCSVAIKMCRRLPEFENAAREEIRVLRDLGGRCGTPSLLRTFLHEQHICMSFNLLGENLKTIVAR